jgi:serine/threonine protein kinase
MAAGRSGIDGATLDDFVKKHSVARRLNVKVDYDLGKILGSGGYSTVRIVTDRESGREFAAKIMRLGEGGAETEHGRLDKENGLRSVMREVYVMRSMHHPRVVHFSSFYIHPKGKSVTIVTELLMGGSLLDILDFKGPMTPHDGILMIQGLTSGIAYVHSRGIVHRDIKPENLMFRTFNDPSSIVLVDFGLACTVEDKFDTSDIAPRESEGICGTLAYMAPEVLSDFVRGENVSVPSFSSDMWSCGIVFFIALSGCFPFKEARNATEFLEYVRAGPCTTRSWDKLPRLYGELMESMLEMDPRKRVTAKDANGMTSRVLFSTKKTATRIRFKDDVEDDPDDDGAAPRKMPVRASAFATSSRRIAPAPLEEEDKEDDDAPKTPKARAVI